jgi:predicted RNase H-like HicB family nuclease
MENYSLPVVIEKDKDGYFGYCPELQGCCTQGETYEEVIANLRDAITLHIQDRQASDEPISKPELMNIATLEVAV